MKAIVRFGPYALVVGIVVFLLSNSRYRIVMGDSAMVVRGAQILRRFLVDWKVPPGPTLLPRDESLSFGRRACGRGIDHFPLFQYVEGLLLCFLGNAEKTTSFCFCGIYSEELLSLLGNREKAILNLFCVVSALAFAGCIVLILGVLHRRSPEAAAAAVLVLVTGPFLWYARCSFGELLAAFLILAYTAACMCGTGPLTIAVLFVAAGLTKETALPFLLLIAAVPLLEARRAGRPYPPLPQFGRWEGGGNRVKAIAWAALVTVVLTAGFNYLRFGTPYNDYNLQPWFRVPNWTMQAEFFAAIWLSPNGGLLFFWLSFVAVLAGLTVVLLRTPRGSRPSLVPLAGVSLLLLGLTLGFSKWYAPFGWPAWGPRLMLPWVPAAVLLLFYYYAEQLQRALAWLCARRARGLFAVAVLVAASLPQAVSLVKTRLFWLRCPPEQVSTLPDPLLSYYHEMAWRLWPTPDYAVLLDCYRELLRGSRALSMALVFTLAVAGFALQVRAAVQRRQAARTPEGDDRTKLLAA